MLYGSFCCTQLSLNLIQRYNLLNETILAVRLLFSNHNFGYFLIVRVFTTVGALVLTDFFCHDTSPMTLTMDETDAMTCFIT